MLIRNAVVCLACATIGVALDHAGVPFPSLDGFAVLAGVVLLLFAA